jgi:hypothetical protein
MDTPIKVILTLLTFTFHFFLGYWISGLFTSKPSWKYGWGLALAVYNTYVMVYLLAVDFYQLLRKKGAT